MSVPSRATIEEAFHAKSTRKTYLSYQKQFIAFCQGPKCGLNPEHATASDVSDFFHHLYTIGRKSRTIDLAKTALVAFFKDRKVEPNPAQNSEAKKYVVSLQKYNKVNNLEEENKAHPLTMYELSILMNGFAGYSRIIGSMFRFLFCGCFLGCFRISEMLLLTWSDISLKKDNDGKYVSLRLRWHKKATVQMECQVYHLADESEFPCLKICGIFEDYLETMKLSGACMTANSYVFPFFHETTTAIKLNWYKPLEQNHVRIYLTRTIQENTELAHGISLHSMRRGGAFYRVFESHDKRFNFRELMAWCRWGDAKTCCEYLITKNLSDGIDPRGLLRRSRNIPSQTQCISPQDLEKLCDAIVQRLQSTNQASPPTQAKQKQTTMDQHLINVIIPTASNAKEAWDQWFVGDAKRGLLQPLMKFNSEMIRQDRRKYSERLTLSLAFHRYSNYDLFAAAYAGFTSSYSKILKEVRKRKINNTL